MADEKLVVLRKLTGLRRKHKNPAGRNPNLVAVLKPHRVAQVSDLSSFFIRLVVLGQFRVCMHSPATNAMNMELAKSHIKECLNCREQLRRLCNEIAELIRSRETKGLG